MGREVRKIIKIFVLYTFSIYENNDFILINLCYDEYITPE